jgi:regulatory protein
VLRATTERDRDEVRPKPAARLVALRMLAQRRLTEAQLRTKLARRGYPEDAICEVVASCRADGFLDDALFAQLFVDGRSKAVGDKRLVADLVRRGIDRDAALRSVAASERDEDARLAVAVDTLFRRRASISYPSAARTLERLGFPASSIYRHLRKRARGDGIAEDSPANLP